MGLRVRASSLLLSLAIELAAVLVSGNPAAWLAASLPASIAVGFSVFLLVFCFLPPLLALAVWWISATPVCPRETS